MNDHDGLEQTLALFHAGDWEQARQALAPLMADDLPPEAAAVWGICETFATAPLDLGGRALPDETRARLDQMLVLGESTGWPEVFACRGWLHLCQLSQAEPETIPAALDQLVADGQASRWFPIWALAIRALVFYGQIQAVSDLLVPAVDQIDDLPEGFRLVIAEALLECGQTAREMLAGIDVQACLPLSAPTADLWRAWLSAEDGWWSGAPLAETQAFLAAQQDTPPADSAPLDLNEWRRISTQTALWRARYALGHRDITQAHVWLDRAADAPAWKIAYLRGLVLWAQGQTEDARHHLEHSLTLNPHQTRVRFELDLLRSTMDPPPDFVLEPIPAVFDTLVSAAAFGVQTRRFDAACQFLEQVKQPEGAYSRLLIWPQARALRLKQTDALRCYLAEAQGDWETVWELAGEVPDDADLTRRAYRLYLLSRYLPTQTAPPRSLVEGFHKELSRLALRPLTGQAMFYRSLAALETMPDRAAQDWRALLRQSEWVVQAAPEHLLWLGDHLLRAGFPNDAQRAYDRAAETGIAGAEDRRRLCQLASRFTFDELPSLADAVPDENLRAFLIGLGGLAESEIDAAREVFERAPALPAPLDQLAHWLTALAADQPGAVQEVCSFWQNIPTDQRAALPPALCLGLDLIGDPTSLPALQSFKAEFGAHWVEVCPFDPADLIFRAVTYAYTRTRYDEALAWLNEAAELGFQVPDEWRALIHLGQSAAAAVSGDFEMADHYRQQVLDDLGGHTP